MRYAALADEAKRVNHNELRLAFKSQWKCDEFIHDTILHEQNLQYFFIIYLYNFQKCWAKLKLNAESENVIAMFFHSLFIYLWCNEVPFIEASEREPW